MHSNEILKAVQHDDLPEGYQGLLERLHAAGYKDGEAITIALLVGMEYGGIFYPLRKIDSAVMSARKRLVLQRLAEGMSYDDAARRYDLSEQTVRELQREQKAAALQKKQLKMFG